MSAKSTMTGLAALVILGTVVAVTVLAQRSPEPVASGRHAVRASGSSAPARRYEPTGSPPSAIAVHRDPFGAAVVALTASAPDTILAAVYDVSTGQEWALGHGASQAEASVVKLDILETLLARYHTTGLPLPAADELAAQLMMEDSDNDAATSLWFAAGGSASISSFNAKAGLRSTVMSECVDCPGFPWPGWGLSRSTPQDQIVLLRQLLSPRSLLTPNQRRYVLGLMEHVTPVQRWGMSSGVPAAVTVALKNGWLPLTNADDDWQINSVGWVSGEGRDYLMAVMTTGSATEQDGITTIDELAAMVWRGMR